MNINKKVDGPNNRNFASFNRVVDTKTSIIQNGARYIKRRLEDNNFLISQNTLADLRDLNENMH